MINGSCASCRYSSMMIGPGNVLDTQHRVCKWGPPFPIAIPFPQGYQISHHWPKMRNDDACGQFSRRQVVETGTLRSVIDDAADIKQN